MLALSDRPAACASKRASARPRAIGRAIALRLDRQWALLTVVGASVATGVDAALLQRRYGFLTGGFLSNEYLSDGTDVAGFLMASLLADAAVIGAIAAPARAVCGRRRWSPVVRSFFALALALGPLLVANFFSYRLAYYLGEAFDLSLMFDLTGRKPLEILAVAGAHLLGPALTLVGVTGVLFGVAWLLERYLPRAMRPAPSLPDARRIILAPAALLTLGLIATGAMRSRSDALDNGLRRKPSGKMLGAIAAFVTDIDRDGYGWLERPADPDPWSRRIVPYAVDLPANGIDEDGVGGDLPAGPPYTEGPATTPPWAFKPPVVLIVLESFRADVIGATRYGSQITPTLNELAARGVSARLAFSHNGYTSQSRHHLFSGSVANIRGSASLIDDFKANGYQAAYFSAQDESFGGPALAVGFDRSDVAYDARVEPGLRYSLFTTAGSLALPFRILQSRIGAFLANRTVRQPLFLYVNFHDTHFPYHHDDIRAIVDSNFLAQSEIGPERAADLRAMYENTAANVDRAVGQVLNEVRRALGTEPAVIVTADHGESLFEEGFLGHGYALNDVQTRIPLIASNLPMLIEEPFGQAGLRDAVRAALTIDPGPARRPVLKPGGSAGVFQYLGVLTDPRQIALRTAAGRTIFDFRTGLVRVGASPWMKPAALDERDTPAFLELIHLWERIKLAREAKRFGAG